MATPNVDKSITVWRNGDISDPYISVTDTLKVINGLVTLREIPDSFTHVSVTGFTEIYEGTPTANQFIVNYDTGVVTFHSSQEAETVVLSYLGRGYLLIPANRVYTDASNPDAIETLQDIVNDTTEAKTNAELATINANDAATAANNATSIANTAATNADEKATLAQTAADNADVATTEANTATENANTATTNANNAATAANTAATNAQTIADETTNKGVWSGVTAYKKNNVVNYSGSGYMALRDNTSMQPDTNSLDWALVGSKGDTGATGPQGIQGLQGETGPQGPKGSNWRDVYNGSTQYAIDDIVSYNGSSYICIAVPAIGTAPTDSTKWSVVAMKGNDGIGTVTSVTSANTDISIATETSTPVLTLNSGTGANQIVKRNTNGRLDGVDTEGGILVYEAVPSGGLIPPNGNGGIKIDNASSVSWNPEYSIAVRSPGNVSWARGLGFIDSLNNSLIMFGIKLTNDTVDYAFIGPSYSQPWLTISEYGEFGIGLTYPYSPSALFEINAGSTGLKVTGTSLHVASSVSSVPSIKRGVQGQIANLDQWQDYNGNNIAYVTNDGVLVSTIALRTKHEGANTPTGGYSGDIRVGNGKIWVNDAGTWKSVAIS